MLGLVCAEGVRASELTSDFAPLGQRTGVLYHTSLELQKQGRQYHTYAPLPPWYTEGFTFFGCLSDNR